MSDCDLRLYGLEPACFAQYAFYFLFGKYGEKQVEKEGIDRTEVMFDFEEKKLKVIIRRNEKEDSKEYPLGKEDLEDFFLCAMLAEMPIYKYLKRVEMNAIVAQVNMRSCSLIAEASGK